MSISHFLLARIAEEEGAAKALLTASETIPGWGSDRGAARVLAECQAKRTIVASREAFSTVSEDPTVAPATRLTGAGAASGLDVAIQYLAAVYADHPDYRQDWKP